MVTGDFLILILSFLKWWACFEPVLVSVFSTWWSCDTWSIITETHDEERLTSQKYRHQRGTKTVLCCYWTFTLQLHALKHLNRMWRLSKSEDWKSLIDKVNNTNPSVWKKVNMSHWSDMEEMGRRVVQTLHKLFLHYASCRDKASPVWHPGGAIYMQYYCNIVNFDVQTQIGANRS